MILVTDFFKRVSSLQLFENFYHVFYVFMRMETLTYQSKLMLRSFQSALDEKVKISPIYPNFFAWPLVFMLLNMEALEACKITIIVISRESTKQTAF